MDSEDIPMRDFNTPINIPRVRDKQDSGYVTQSPPNTPSIKSLRGSFVGHGNSQPATSVKESFEGLLKFEKDDKSIDVAILTHYATVRREIENGISKCIKDKFHVERCRSAVRLVFLGQSEDEAKPCVVVFVQQEWVDEARKYLNKDPIQSFLQLKDHALPDFPVYLVGTPPKTKHGDEVSDVLTSIAGESSCRKTETYCGAPIVIQRPNSITQRSTTFGGVIKIEFQNGDSKLCGLTVGHVLLDDKTTKQSDYWDVWLSDSGEALGNCRNDLVDESATPPQKREWPPDSGEVLGRCWNDPIGESVTSASQEREWVGVIRTYALQHHAQLAPAGKIGHVPKAYYDWALIEELVHYKPNCICHKTLDEPRHSNFKFGDLVMPKSPSDYAGKMRSVVVLSGSEGPKRGHLSALPSSLLLGPGEDFIDTLIVRLDNNKQILDGDSGSWVVDEQSLEVYGYIVATDVFGEGYVIPIVEALQDIKNALGAQYIDIANPIDIASDTLCRMPEHGELYEQSPATAPLFPHEMPELEAERTWTQASHGIHSFNDSGYCTARTSAIASRSQSGNSSWKANTGPMILRGTRDPKTSVVGPLVKGGGCRHRASTM